MGPLGSLLTVGNQISVNFCDNIPHGCSLAGIGFRHAETWVWCPTVVSKSSNATCETEAFLLLDHGFTMSTSQLPMFAWWCSRCHNQGIMGHWPAVTGHEIRCAAPKTRYTKCVSPSSKMKKMHPLTPHFRLIDAGGAGVPAGRRLVHENICLCLQCIFGSGENLRRMPCQRAGHTTCDDDYPGA